MLLAAVIALAVATYGPGGWTAYHRWNLQRLPLAQLEARVQRHPNDLEARYRLGLVYSQENRYPEATRELLAVLERDPSRADVLNDLGVVYLLQQRYYESLVALQAALTARPHFAEAYANMGRLHLATKMPFTAARELQEAARLDPDRPDTLCDLGEAYQRTLNFRAAEQAFQNAVRLSPRSVAAHVGLGRAYFARTRYAEAERSLRKALEVEPEHPGALLTLARIQMEKATTDAHLEEARALLQRSARSDPAEPEVWYDLGRVELRLRRPAEAVALLQRTLRLSSGHSGAMYQLSRALRAAGKPKQAERVAVAFREAALRAREESRLEERIHESPDDWDSRVRLVELYMRSNKEGLAVLVLRQLQQGAPNHPRLAPLLRELSRRQALAASSTPPGPSGSPTNGPRGR